MRRNKKESAIQCISIFCIMIILMMSIALGEHDAWDCQNCGRSGNTRNYCGSCGSPAPWISGSANEPADEYQEAYPEIEAALDAKYSVGNYVTFGHYPQTSTGNDSTAIEWLVLARDGNKALLLSRYGLDVQPYNTDATFITWEECTLRTWLNDTFLNKTFTKQEQAGILLTNVDNSNSQGYSEWSASGGNNTQDKVFLLSRAEANKYLGVIYGDNSNTKSRVAPTAYAMKQGAFTNSRYKTEDGMDAGWWWLRSPGYYQKIAAVMSPDGSLYYCNVHNGIGCVRPALWVNLESDIF